MSTHQEFYPAQNFSPHHRASVGRRQVKKYLRAHRLSAGALKLARALIFLALALAVFGCLRLIRGHFDAGWVLLFASFLGVVGRLLLLQSAATQASLETSIAASSFLTEGQKTHLLED